jgi:hypothetical protein
MKNIGRLLMFISIIIGVLIDCNVFKESIEIPIIVSGITFLLGIYILMLCENKVSNNNIYYNLTMFF